MESKFKKESVKLMDAIRKRYGVNSVFILTTREGINDLGIGTQHSSESVMGLTHAAQRALPSLLREIAGRIEQDDNKEKKGEVRDLGSSLVMLPEEKN